MMSFGSAYISTWRLEDSFLQIGVLFDASLIIINYVFWLCPIDYMYINYTHFTHFNNNYIVSVTHKYKV